MAIRKVCFFNTSPFWGGGEKWHFQMACQLRVKGIEVFVASNPEGLLYKKCIERGIDVLPVHVNNLSFLNPFHLIRLRKLFKKHKIDALIINSSAELKAAGIAGHLAGLPCIVYRRGLDAPVKNRFLTRYIFQNILQGIVVNSKATLQRIMLHGPNFVKAAKLKVIYNGLDLSEYDDVGVLKDGQRTGSRILLGTSGRLVLQKGHSHLIEIAGELKKSGLDFRLYIAGTGMLGKFLEALVKEKGLEGEIEFLGFIHDVPAFLNSIDIYLHPSQWEGFGYSIAEAMACSRPVVAFNISSNPELIVEGKTGYLVDLEDYKGFAKRISKLASNPEKRKQMGEAGRRRVEEYFSIEKNCAELLSWLERIRN